jgi:hypothetical protein
MSEHSRKVLLRFEAAGHGNIQDGRLRRAQHLLRPLQQLDTILYSEMIYVSSMTIEPAVANIIPCETDLVVVSEKGCYDDGVGLAVAECKGRGGEITEEDVRKLSRVADAFRKTGFTRTSFFQRSRRSRRRRLRGAAPRSRRGGSA